MGSAYQELERRGVALMGWADPFMPDRSLPDFIEQAWLDAVRQDAAPHYTAPIGDAELKQAIAKKLQAQNGLTVDPERNILITPGSDSGLYFAILPFVHPGDEVLIPCPSYPNNFLDVRIMGGTPVPVQLRPETGYQLDLAAMEAAVTPRTRMVVLTHPNNPTTTVYDRASLEGLADFVIRHDLVLVVDQAFEDFTFGNEMISPAALPGMFERTVTVFSFSKGMGLSGLRVGYIVCDDRIMDAMYANAVAVIGATSTSAQRAMLAALARPDFMRQFADAYDRRRKRAFEVLNSIPGVSMQMPQSGFLCWVDVSALGSSADVAAYLLEQAGGLGERRRQLWSRRRGAPAHRAGRLPRRRKGVRRAGPHPRRPDPAGRQPALTPHRPPSGRRKEQALSAALQTLHPKKRKTAAENALRGGFAYRRNVVSVPAALSRTSRKGRRGMRCRRSAFRPAKKCGTNGSKARTAHGRLQFRLCKAIVAGKSG